MKKHVFTIALSMALVSTSAMVGAQQMDPNIPGMHDKKPADAEGVGVVKALDVAKATITLQHEAITAIGWPAMTMPFKVASPDLLKNVKVGDKVKFTLHSAGAASAVTSIVVER